jgi:DNA-binding CsgD family transcriptional regulator
MDELGHEWSAAEPAPLVLAWINHRLAIERISCGIGDLLGYTSDTLVGVSLLAIVAPGDRPRLVSTIGQAVPSRVDLVLRFSVQPSGTRTCRLILVPAEPRPSWACAVIACPPRSRPVGAEDGNRDPMAGLTRRERQVAEALARGDRVAAIGRALCLTPGTVRNHLSSAYRKLGVHGQQELIELLRSTPARR